MKDEVFKYVIEVLNVEDTFSRSNWNKLHEKDRFYNWYYAYTSIEPPYHDSRGLNILIETLATSGVLTTKYFGEKFNPELVEQKIVYLWGIASPRGARDNENVTLHFKVEKVQLSGISAVTSMDKLQLLFDDWHAVDPDLSNVYKNFTPPGSSTKTISLQRFVSSEEVEQVKLEVMPGFRFSWWYSGAVFEPEPQSAYRNYDLTKEFVR